jgi:transglutaminase-like putative cysteine protease/tetratricopeptide (TPR) repeat protein
MRPFAVLTVLLSAVLPPSAPAQASHTQAPAAQTTPTQTVPATTPSAPTPAPAATPSASAQALPTTPAADAFPTQALVFERSETAYRMHADGTGERDVHAWLRIQSEGAAQQFGVLAFSYAAASETPKIILVRVHKPDGTTVDTPVTEAIEMSSAVTRDAPLYSDLKELHLPVRSLSVGDTLEYDVHTSIDKAEAPGQFWGSYRFTPPASLIILSEVLTLEAPKDKYVQVWSPNHKSVVTDHGDLRTWRWESSQLVPAPKAADPSSNAPKPPKDPDQDADGRLLPSVAWTTFQSWAQVGDWYRALALPRSQPDEALRARADEITKDAKTPEDQIRALYAFVSTGTRYIGIDFGVGRYQPHAASAVLANQYGDCKDKDTLLEALLRAKGFSTAPALIGAGIAPVQDVPSPAFFNHVITTVNLPGGRIWLDSTPAVGPYQYLSAIIRDQAALVVPADAPASLQRTPALPPYPLVAKFEDAGALDAEGKFTSHVTASYRTDEELFVRTMALNIAPAEWDKASQYVSSSTGFSGTTSNTRFSSGADLSSPVVLSYDYSRHPYGDWDDRRIVPALPALEFSALDSDTTAPPADIQLGAPRTLIAVSRIALPAGYRTDLPDPIHVKTDFATFDKTYRFDGKEIVTERTIVVLKSKLPAAEWKQYQSFTKDISLGTEPWIQLIEPSVHASTTPDSTPRPSTLSSRIAGNGTITGAAASPVPGGPVTGNTTIVKLAPPAAGTPKPAATDLPADASVQQLMQSAAQQIQSRNWSGATDTLDRVKAKNPNEQNLWSSYGFIAAVQKNYDQAKTNYKKELSTHPDNVYAVGALADVENKSGDSGAARQTLQGYLAGHPGTQPGNLRLSLFLASLQTLAEDNEGALATLQSAADQNPDDRSVRLQLSNALLALDHKEEAAAAAKSVLDGTDDTLLLNNAAYVLAETGLDLAYAEETSRKSITTLEAKSAAITTEEVNSSAYAQTSLLLASWDTLGWIIYREGRPQDALPWIAAAWRNDLRPDVGDHLGQIYEALGKKDQALTAYRLAQAAIDRNNLTPDVRRHITESIARLTSAGVKSSVPSGMDALQNLRSYKIPRAGASGWGTFRIQVSTTGVVGSQQVSGEHKLASITASINAMKLPELLPPDSKAHLLRTAVVSCSEGKTCDVVFVPNSTLRNEQP